MLLEVGAGLENLPEDAAAGLIGKWLFFGPKFHPGVTPLAAVEALLGFLEAESGPHAAAPARLAGANTPPPEISRASVHADLLKH